MTMIFRQDRKAIKALGGMASMEAYKVTEWESSGRGQYRKHIPVVWDVPDSLIAELGIRPIGRKQASLVAKKRRMAGQNAYQTYLQAVNAASSKLGLLPGSRTAKRLLAGEIDQEVAQRIAERCITRHEGTKYDEHLKHTDKETARALSEMEEEETHD